MIPLPAILGLAQFAPHLMRFFGAGQDSTAVVERVADIAMSVSGTGTPEEALQAISANSELQAAFRMRTLEADTELEKAYLTDRADARARDVALRQAGHKNRRADLMIVLDVVGLVACIAAIVWFREALPGEAVGIIATVAGVFGACLRDAHQFEFGSSRGSKDKDAALAGAMRK